MVVLRTKGLLDMVYIRRLKTLNLPFQFCAMLQTTDEIALLDSRATENFIDEGIWRKLNIGWVWLQKPLTVYKVDGMENRQGKIDSYCWLRVHYQNRSLPMCFYLTSLGTDRFILGYPFLFVFNLDIDWRAARLKGGAVDVETIL